MQTIDIFIPSYHRPTNIKTAKYLISIDYDMSKVHVVIDSEADDADQYRKECERMGCKLHVFDMDEARRRYDYVHRASESRRSAGQARNMFYEIAKAEGITQYLVMDDDTENFQFRTKGYHPKGERARARARAVSGGFAMVADFCKRHKIGLFGICQSGDFYGTIDARLMRHKVMNTTFYDTKFIYRGERGVQDDDTSQFVTVLNEGYFTGSKQDHIVLKQMQSATQKGGLTDLYNECKLLNKALVCVIQFPSAVIAEKQKMNGGRVHHRINYRFLAPKLLKVAGHKGNIAWDTYPEDVPFTNEPKRT